MSILPKDSVKVVAETLGLTDINNDIAGALASDTEYRVREIIQEAMKFMKHAKRDKLTTGDINAALRLRNVEQLYGYSGDDKAKFERAINAKGLFFIHDEEVSLNDIINTTLPKVPREVTLTSHWLAVEGVQPAIPQNPLVAENDTSAAVTPAASAAAAAAAAAATAATSSTPASVDVANASAASTGAVDARPLVKHRLSAELQTYFEKVTSAVRAFVVPPGADDIAIAEWRACEQSLTTDGGLQQLVPYFIQFVSDEVARSLRQHDILTILLKFCQAMSRNSTLDIEPYLHQLMPPILTILLAHRGANAAVDDDWTLRDDAAKFLSVLCVRFGSKYTNLQPRVTRTLLQTLLDPARPLTTHYGAIRGLSQLGPHVIAVLLMPNVAPYVSLLMPKLNANPPSMAAQRCFDALRDAACKYVSNSGIGPNDAKNSSDAIKVEQKTTDDGDADDDRQDKMAVDDKKPSTTVHTGLEPVSFQTLHDIFGESLVAFVKQPSTLPDVTL